MVVYTATFRLFDIYIYCKITETQDTLEGDNHIYHLGVAFMKIAHV